MEQIRLKLPNSPVAIASQETSIRLGFPSIERYVNNFPGKIELHRDIQIPCFRLCLELTRDTGSLTFVITATGATSTRVAIHEGTVPEVRVSFAIELVYR